MKKLVVMAVALAAVSFAPMAAHATSCGTAADESEATLPASMLPAPATQGDVYIDADTVGVYQEANGKPGLQTSAKAGCWSADAKLTPDVPGAPTPPSVPPLPVTPPALP